MGHLFFSFTQSLVLETTMDSITSPTSQPTNASETQGSSTQDSAPHAPGKQPMPSLTGHGGKGPRDVFELRQELAALKNQVAQLGMLAVEKHQKDEDDDDDEETKKQKKNLAQICARNLYQFHREFELLLGSSGVDCFAAIQDFLNLYNIDLSEDQYEEAKKAVKRRKVGANRLLK